MRRWTYRKVRYDEHYVAVVACAWGARVHKHDVRAAGDVKQQATTVQSSHRLLAAARSGAAAARNINVVETNAGIAFQSEVHYDAAYSTAITSQKKRGGAHGWAG